MTDLTHTFTAILTSASVYLLIGLGWNLVYNASGYLNLALGEFYILGAVLTFELQGVFGGGLGPRLAAGAVAVGAMAVLALVCDVALLRPLRDRKLGPLIATLGLGLVLLQVSRYFIPTEVIRPAALLDGPPLTVFGADIQRQALLVWATAAALTAGLWWFFMRTDAGRSMRACADDHRAARGLGVPVAGYATAAFTASAVFAAVAGFVVAPTQGITYNIGMFVALKSFMAVSIGGIGRYGGAAVGALVVASAEVLVARYWSSQFRDLVVLAGFLVVLYIHAVRAGEWTRRRPQRLFARS